MLSRITGILGPFPPKVGVCLVIKNAILWEIYGFAPMIYNISILTYQQTRTEHHSTNFNFILNLTIYYVY